MSEVTSEIPATSYGQILRSSSIIGGTNAINYLVGLVRIKVVAVLLGPTGVGLISLYTSATALIGTVSGLGLASSGVREVARAYSDGDPVEAARTVRILRRLCWATGLLGWLLAIGLARPLSQWLFNSPEHAMAIALLGATLLFGAVGGGQLAILQGMRRIGDLARITVIAMLLNTGVTIALYAWLREQGIVPVLVATSLVSLGVSWWFVRRVPVPPVSLTWPGTLAGTRQLAGLGLAFMWAALLTTGLDMATRAIIVREHGIEAAGLYQAAWALSGMFAGFILGAMGADFYPRLTAAIRDREQAVRLVNEQTEIGILLALPGLLVTLALAPLIVRLVYSEDFLPAAGLLPWLLTGVFLRVVSWPLGFIQLAKGSGRWFAATETTFIGIQLGLVYWLVPAFGIMGAAVAFAIIYVLHTAAMLVVGRILIGFFWSPGVIQLLLASVLFWLVAMTLSITTTGWKGMLFGAVLAMVCALVSLRGLSARLGGDPRWLMHLKRHLTAR